MTPGIMWIVPGMIKVETGWDIIISTEMILFLIRAAVMRKVQDGCFIYQFVRWIQDQPILVQMLPIQAIVLLLFQGDECYSFEMIQNRTHISELLLKQVISSLLFSQFQVLLHFCDDNVVIEEGTGSSEWY